MLNAARLLLEERGYEAFAISELCDRYEMPRRTFYNAFGSKDQLISDALTQFMADVQGLRPSGPDPSTMEGRLWNVAFGLGISALYRNYTETMMSLYYTRSSHHIRPTIFAAHAEPLRTFLNSYVQGHHLAQNVEINSFVEVLTSTHYGLLADWCLGDDDPIVLIERDAASFLSLLQANVVGSARQEAAAALGQVRGGAPAWIRSRDDALDAAKRVADALN